MKPLITMEKPTETPKKQDTANSSQLQEKAGALISSNNAAAAAHAIANEATMTSGNGAPSANTNENAMQHYERLMAAQKVLNQVMSLIGDGSGK